MKKWIALVLAALMLVAALSACAAKKAEAPAETTSEQTAESPKTVSEETYYYICPLASLEYWQAHRNGLEDACKELGVTPKFVGNDKLDCDAMVAIIETAINDPNCAGIITACHFPDAYEPLVKKAKEKGIPVCSRKILDR